MQIKVNGVNLFYTKKGQGRPLVLLHGNGEDHSLFDEAVEALQGNFCCYAIDSRGHGKSQQVPELHYADMARDVLAFMDALNLRDVVLCGFSDGGIVGLLAAGETDRISHLLLCGANTRPETLVPEAYGEIFREYCQSPNIYNTLLVHEPHISLGDMKRIRAKTLVVAGSRDIIQEADTRFIAASIPGAKLLILSGEDHGSYIAHSPRIGDIIQDFFKGAEPMDYVIRDISLYNSGEDKIEWVRRNMPLLSSLWEDLSREKPFAGLTIGLSVHLEAKTAFLCRVLQAGGARMVVTGSNPLSTQDDVAAALVHGNGESAPMQVYALHGCTMEEYMENIDRVLLQRPNILIDDGGDLVSGVMERFPELKDHIIGGCEETTTGVIRLKAMERDGALPFPMMDVNDADCKHLFDNRYGTGQSVFDGIDRTTNLIVAGKTCVVAGYGWCGKGVSLRAKGLGAKVVVTEVDPIKAIEAIMDGFAVMPMEKAAREGDLFITVTGDRDVITQEHFALMKDGAILCNAGHFDVEVDVKWLRENAQEIRSMKPNIEGYRLTNGKWVYVLAQGRLVNLASGDGHPAEIMDMSFAIQALSARHLVKNRGTLENRLYAVPREVDLEVARRKLAALNVQTDTLTKAQEDYLSAWRV